MRYISSVKRTRPLTLDGYQLLAARSDQNHEVGNAGLRTPLLGLFGEVGSLLTLPKRKSREDPLYEKYEDSLLEEVGDVLWYMSNLALRHRASLSSLGSRKLVDSVPNTEKGWRALTNRRSTFRQVQRQSDLQDPRRLTFTGSDFFSLGAIVGRLMYEYAGSAKWELHRNEFRRHLGAAFRLLVNLANAQNIDLDLAAKNNLAKIHSRWPAKKVPPALFDEKYDSYERLPRRIEMHFIEREIHGRPYVYQQCNGVAVGDRLTDNKLEKDDYRFHDVFHLGYAANLGWSPVLRSLFRVKRKSDPSVDENQDGARAVLVEEGLASWLFSNALENQLFAETRNLDYSLLKAVRHFVAGYEVERCPLWLWEKAILESFTAFRKLKLNRKGWVIADLKNRRLSYLPSQD